MPATPRATAIEPLGEDALLLRLGSRIDATTNARVHALAARIAARRPPWLRELVPAYASLALFVDVDADSGATDPLARARAWLAALLDAIDEGDDGDADGRLVEVRVRYGDDDGPDLAAVAAHVGLAPDEVVARHCDAEYRVAMLGFAPGFPYLLGLDPGLALPRLATPRPRVPAGSVGIGGAQTGVYPRESPGGWRLIGRTPWTLFDALREPPSLLSPGDRVRFVPTERA